MPILKNTQNQFSRVDIDKDKVNIFHAERVPDSFYKANQEQRKDKRAGWSKDGDLRHVARVPAIKFYEWVRNYPEILSGDKKEGDKALWKLLRDQEILRSVEKL
jgi:hypothetical protein